MAELNPHYQKLHREYIFPVIDKKLEELRSKVPAADVLNFGVGDIALPLAPSIVAAICSSIEEMGHVETMRGYGPSEGYLFLREAIAKNEYAQFGLSADEVFISDGINSDIANIQELFSMDAMIGIPDPTYPVYLDANVMAGRGDKIVILPCTEKTGFLPVPPDVHCDVIYLCSPNNPTGVAMNRGELTAWVEYAKREKAIILFDNAYTAFITSPDVPLSIYEIDGAKEVAIEMRSFSKNAGFTGLRCSYTILPQQVTAMAEGKLTQLHPLWMRRQNTKFNGVAYPIQKGALATYTAQGKKETTGQVSLYQAQAKAFREGLTRLGYTVFGGLDSPYIWWKTPEGLKSWDFFDRLLEKCHLLAIPGTGFGQCGEGFIRISAFTTEDKVKEALQRIQTL